MRISEKGTIIVEKNEIPNKPEGMTFFFGPLYYKFHLSSFFVKYSTIS